MNRLVGFKKCPFCASPHVYVERSDFSSCYVTCNGCGARGPTMCQESDRESTPGRRAAIREWNRRAL
jgi:Lar family restriction alleviation protein